METSTSSESPLSAELIERFKLRERKCRDQHGELEFGALCTVCEAMNLKAMLAPADSQIAGHMRGEIHLGSLSQIQDCSGHCPFCKFVLEQLPAVIGLEAMPPKHTDYKEFDFTPYPKPVDHWTYSDYVPGWEEIIVMLSSMRGDCEECQDLPMMKLEDYLKEPTAIWLDMVIHSGGPGTNTPKAGMAITCKKFVPCSESLGGQPLSGRVIPVEVEYSELRGHLDTCLEKHEECFLRDVHSAVVEKHFWLIDIANNRVVLADQNTEYAALSYVWGRSRHDYTHFKDFASKNAETWPDVNMPLDEGGGPSTELPQDLPATISDAVEFCRKLDIGYLWIDSICIDQESQAMKDYLIERMDSIYMRAKITILAAAGEDADAGLPGVRPGTRKDSRTTVELKGVKLITAYPFAKRLIADSTWWKRAWTFQEGWLSPRCFIFTDQEVLFCCTRSTNRESLYSCNPLCRNGLTDQLFQTQEVGFPTGVGQVNKARKFGTLFNNVMTLYHKRKLTFEGDRINAIQGCVKTISERFGLPNWCGMPMQWREGAGALIWRHMEPAKRTNLEFPSYSWASWNQAPFYIDYLIAASDVADIYEIEPHPDIPSFPGCPGLLVKGEVAKLYIKPDEKGEWHLDEQKHPKQPSWVLSEYHMEAGISEEERERIISGPSEFLALAKGFSPAAGQVQVVTLMIERMDGYVVRRSLFCVTHRAWFAAQPEMEEVILL